MTKTMKMDFRTAAVDKRYARWKKTKGVNGECGLCPKKPLKSFRHWIIVKNDFPYDKIATRHDMILSRRHAPEPKLTPQELRELRKIKERYIHKTYEFIIEATYKKKSIPDHFHLHLINAREDI